MTRLMWFIGGVILGLIGWDMLIRDFLGWTGYLVIGIGIGIGTAVLGSFAHDFLAGSRERL